MSCGLLLITLANAANVLGDTVDPSIETVIVTATRQATAGANLAQAWSDIDATEVDKIDLQHSNQLFNRVSGAWVSRGNGQESLISLRSPVLTGAGACGAFYTAEDGINLRAPGFCNVNQLFDANLLQAGGVEVVKGPANAVFGSNAMHGVINVLTRSAADTTPALGIQAGSRDFIRTRVSLRNGG
ncbi:MAG TPA: TonB-dependent receptor, partial [Halieaceae bacterium]|nr:TonB-dependent receptor [Halieaceae bacterium]